MTELAKNRTGLRAWGLATGTAGALFWLYTFYAIAQVPKGDGTGFQWIAVIPLGSVFLFLTLPGLLLSWWGRVPWLGLALGTAGLIAFAIIWRQLLGEFYH